MYQWRNWVAERMATPRVVGHEFCGTVARSRFRVDQVKVGDFVAVGNHIVDGTC